MREGGPGTRLLRGAPESRLRLLESGRRRRARRVEPGAQRGGSGAPRVRRRPQGRDRARRERVTAAVELARVLARRRMKRAGGARDGDERLAGPRRGAWFARSEKILQARSLPQVFHHETAGREVAAEEMRSRGRRDAQRVEVLERRPFVEPSRRLRLEALDDDRVRRAGLTWTARGPRRAGHAHTPDIVPLPRLEQHGLGHPHRGAADGTQHARHRVEGGARRMGRGLARRHAGRACAFTLRMRGPSVSTTVKT